MGRDSLSRRLSDIQLRINALQAEARPIREQLGNIDRTIQDLLDAKDEVEDEMRLAATKPYVSDHAVIRWLERKHGFSFEKTRQEMLTEGVVAAIEAGADKIKVDAGRFIVREKCIVTFIGGAEK